MSHHADNKNDQKIADKKIISLWVGPMEQSLKFICEDSVIVWDTDADCCSESWFADIVGVDALLGATVRSVEEMDMSSIGYTAEDGRCRQESDQVYGYKIITTQGWCDVIFRNSSNGYYGGSMSARETAGPSASSKGWRRVRDDWSADAPKGQKPVKQAIPAWTALRESRELAKVSPNPSAPTKRAKQL